MKVDIDNEQVTLVLIPENEEEKEFLQSWWANANFGSVDLQYHFRDIKTGAIGIRVYKEEKSILRVVKP